jgi:hypothetical protein
MKLELKRLHPDSIDSAIKRAEHYRLLNESLQAESICLDVLACEPGNQRALILLLLARTDQFGEAGTRADDARRLLPDLTSEYDRFYYAGIICERWAKSLLREDRLGSGPAAYDWLRQAMGWYERAEPLAEKGNNDPILRWNACARLIERHHLGPAHDEGFHPLLE